MSVSFYWQCPLFQKEGSRETNSNRTNSTQKASYVHKDVRIRLEDSKGVEVVLVKEIHLLENTDETLITHTAEQCKSDHWCCIHSMSNHIMRSFPQHWREDRGIMERTCPHGVGHCDPDDYKIVNGEDDGTHGCCGHGCCGEQPIKQAEISPELFPQTYEYIESLKAEIESLQKGKPRKLKKSSRPLKPRSVVLDKDSTAWQLIDDTEIVHMEPNPYWWSEHQEALSTDELRQKYGPLKVLWEA